jgi:hypothetical protein
VGLDQERDGADARRQREAARASAAEIWAAYAAGAPLWSSFTTADGITIDPQIVGDTVYDWFRDHQPRHFAELTDRFASGEYQGGAVTCADGTVIREDLAMEAAARFDGAPEAQSYSSPEAPSTSAPQSPRS